MNSQYEKAEKLKYLHNTKEILVIPNAYDAISAAVIAAEGFEAVATTSGGCAISAGYCDGENITLSEMTGIVKTICNAVSIPVSADMEAGYGVEPDEVSNTVKRTLEVGAVGLNIEDSRKNGDRVLFDYDISVARIQAARYAIDEFGIPAVLNARTDVFSTRGNNPIEEAIKRANAYLEVGADCTFVIGVSDIDIIKELANQIDGPLNILAGPESPSVIQLQSLGVQRVSFGSGFAKVAISEVRRSLRYLLESGTCDWNQGLLSQSDIKKLLGQS